MQATNSKGSKTQSKTNGSDKALPSETKPEVRGEHSRPKSGMSSPLMKSSSIIIDVSDVEYKNPAKIRTTLELIKDNMNKLKHSKSQLELKNFDGRCFPYLLAVLASGMNEFHSTTMHLLLSTFDHFDSCNDAYSDLIGSVLDLYEYNPSVFID